MGNRSKSRPNNESKRLWACRKSLVVIPKSLCICEGKLGGEPNYLIWIEDTPSATYTIGLPGAEDDFNRRVEPFIEELKTARRELRASAEYDLIEAVLEFLERHTCVAEEAAF
jgi:hypothetical protein